MLEQLVKNSYSISQVLRQLGLAVAGGTHWHISKKIKTYGIDTSHFTGQAANKGKRPVNKKSWSEILVKSDSDYKIGTEILRRALVESGREYKCESCALKDTWNGNPICIQIDHINGNWTDNTPSNLRFLCPNCHSQTSTFGMKNVKCKPIKTKICVACGMTFAYTQNGRKYCSYKCSNRKENRTIKTKIVWPEKDALLKMLSESNYSQLGKTLGVSDNAIRKHLKQCRCG
jgi:hypothetical protein